MKLIVNYLQLFTRRFAGADKLADLCIVLSRILKKMENEYDVVMYGAIGTDFSGNDLAHWIKSIDEQADTIHLRINSPGGDVEQGLSIVSAILSARAYIHVHVDGIALSMAAVIAVCGDRVEMQDYAKMMIHDPFFRVASESLLSNKDKKYLSVLKDSMQTILSRRNIDKELLGKMMAEETWFTADEAKAAGLADEVVVTQRKELKNLAAPELLKRISAELVVEESGQRVWCGNFTHIIKEVDMKLVAVKLGLAEASTESEVVNKVGALQGELSAAVAERDTLKQKLAAIEAKQAAEQKTEAEALVAAAVADGRINADGRSAWMGDFEKDFEGAKSRLASIPAREKISAQVEKGAEGNGGEKPIASMTFAEIVKADRLRELKKDNALYVQKFRDAYGHDPA